MPELCNSAPTIYFAVVYHDSRLNEAEQWAVRWWVLQNGQAIPGAARFAESITQARNMIDRNAVCFQSDVNDDSSIVEYWVGSDESQAVERRDEKTEKRRSRARRKGRPPLNGLNP